MNGKIRNIILAQNTKAFGIIFFVILATYIFPLALHRDQNPILQRSGLATSIQRGFISGQSTIDPNDGFTSQALGHKAAQSWLNGNVPYWNHDEGVGVPLAAGMQSAAFFPLTLLLHFYYGIIYFHFLLQLIAGMAAYLFFKKLKLRLSLAVLGGTLFALSGTFAWLTNAAFNPIAFLPVLLLGIECAFSRAKTKKKGGWLIIALALSLSLYSGFPETAFINAIFAYGWAVMRLLYINKKARNSYIYKVLIGSVVGLLLTAPAIVAFIGYLPYAVTGGHSGNAYANFGLPLKTIPALFMPYIYGPIFGYVNSGNPANLFVFWSNVGGYLTIPLLLMGTLGLYAKRALGLKLYLSIFTIIAILKIYGFKPVVFLVNLIPGMHQVAFYRYSMSALSFAVIMLAIFGADAFIKSEISRKKVITVTLIISVFVGVLALYSRSLLHQLTAYPSHRWWALLSVAWSLSILIVIVLAFLKSKLKLAGVILLLFVDTFVMFIIPHFSLPKIPSIDYGPVTFLQKNLGNDRFYTLHPIAPNYGSYFGIASININDLPIPTNWDNYIPQKLDDNVNPVIFTGNSRVAANQPSALDEFGKNETNFEDLSVKYLVTDRGQVSDSFRDGHGLKLVYTSTNVEIYQLPNTKDYFEPGLGCGVTPSGRDIVNLNCSHQTSLLRRELFMPGWSATVNGVHQPLQLSNQIFQSVSVPTGKSIVKYAYNPPHIAIGYLGFGAGLISIVVIIIVSEPKLSGRKLVTYFRRTVKLK